MFLCSLLGSIHFSHELNPHMLSKFMSRQSSTKPITECSYYCYILYNNNKTYAGYTTNLHRRLRQHNMEISGGAKATRMMKMKSNTYVTETTLSTTNCTDWKYLTVLTSPNWKCKSDAMKVEYLHKFPTRRKPRPAIYNRPLGRIKSFQEIFKHLSINNTGFEKSVATNNNVTLTFDSKQNVDSLSNDNFMKYTLYVHENFRDEMEQVLSEYSNVVEVSSLSNIYDTA